MKSAEPFFSLLDASFRLGDRLVFEKTSWVFYRQEHWAVVGANGSGKSLLGDALCGRLPLVEGRLQYHFRGPRGTAPEDFIAQVSFEQRRLDLRDAVVQSRWNSIEEESGLLVRNFLSYEKVMEVNPFEVTDRHEKARFQFERRRRQAIDLLGIAPYLERLLISLSNGETQRAQLARALCRPLRLLILDEPFQGLDVSARQYFHGVLEQLMHTPLRVLLIATRIEDLPRHITHLLFVDHCRVIAAGPVAEVQTLPEVKRLLLGGKARRTFLGGSNPMFSGNPPERQVQSGPASKVAGVREPSELVRLRDVTVRYGAVAILQNVNWTIRAGESWALLGPNGSGKSTLLSLILGDNPQVYKNDVVVFGRQRGTGESIWEIKKRIGWVSPELQLHFDDAITCFDAVASGFFDTIGLFEAPTSRQRAAVRRWLARFGLAHVAQMSLSSLSAGLQRMVLLTRALVKQPKLLILDEPCQGLDRRHREFFVKAVNALICAKSETVIFVTHRQDELPPSIKNVLRLSHGEGVIETGKKEEMPPRSRSAWRPRRLKP